MKILLDERVNWRVKRALIGHEVSSVQEQGWSTIKNGALLNLADQQFDVLLTIDRNIPYQQNMQGRHIAIFIMLVASNRIESLLPVVPSLLEFLSNVQSGQVYRVEGPKPDSLDTNVP